MEPTTVEVYPNRTEFILHRRRERFHDRNITIKPYTDEFDAIYWSRISVSSQATERLIDVRELSPPVVNTRLRMNVHNLRHWARGALGGTDVVDVVFLQQFSPHLFEGKISLTQLRQERPARQALCPGSRRAKKSLPRYAPPLSVAL